MRLALIVLALGCAAPPAPLQEEDLGADVELCQPYDSRACMDGALYFFDSCGQPGEIAYECPASSSCSDDTCTLRASLTDSPRLQVPAGYPSSWISGPAGLRQTRLADDASDIALIDFRASTSFDLEVIAASTEVTSFDSDDLRHVMVFIEGRGSDAANAKKTAGYACGAEVRGILPKTSIVQVLDDSAVEPLARADRPVLLEKDEFTIRVAYDGATLTCITDIGGVETVVEASVDLDASSALGFYTRESKAKFRNLTARAPL